MANQKASLWTKNFIMAIIIYTAVYLANNMLYSTISIYAKGMTNIEWYIGLVTSASTFASLATRFFSGKLFDIMTIKRLLLCGLTISLCSDIGYLLTSNINVLIFLRGAHGFGHGISTVAVATLVTVNVPRERLLEGLGYSTMINSLTVALGPAISLAITQSDAARFRPVFMLCVVLYGCSILLLTQVYANKREVDAVADTGCIGRLTISMATVLFGVMTFMVALSQSSVVAYINLYAKESALGNMTMFFTVFAIVSCSIRFFMGRVLEIISENKALILALVFGVGTYIGIFLSDHALPIYILGAPMGVAMGLAYPILNGKILRTMSRTKQGVANTVYLAANDAAFALGAIFWSIVAGHFGGYRIIYLLAAVAIGIGLALDLLKKPILRLTNTPEKSEC